MPAAGEHFHDVTDNIGYHDFGIFAELHVGYMPPICSKALGGSDKPLFLARLHPGFDRTPLLRVGQGGEAP